MICTYVASSISIICLNFVYCHCLGSSLTPCGFSGQQCCDPSTISFFKFGIDIAINGYAPRLVSGFATAQDAIDELRNTTKGM